MINFQGQVWYETNKDNFVNSNFFKAFKVDQKLNNYVEPFHASDIVSFGIPNKLVTQLGDIYYIKIPKGMNVYHASRSLVLNHAPFPILSWNSNITDQENSNVSDNNFITQCDDKLKFTDCRPLTYYSSVPQTEYATRTMGPFKNAADFSFGVPDPFSRKDDRFSYYSDNLAESGNPNRIASGFLSYKTKEDRNFILMMDPFLSRLGAMVTIVNVRTLTQKTVLEIPDKAKASAGISLAANMRTVREWLGFTGGPTEVVAFFAAHISGLIKFGIDKGLNAKDMISNMGGLGFIMDALLLLHNGDASKLGDLLGSLYDSPTDSIPGYENNDLKNWYSTQNRASVIPGFRTSTYEFDRPLHANFRFTLFSHKFNTTFYGFVGGYMYSPRFLGTVDYMYNENSQVNGLVIVSPGKVYPSSDLNMFHTEIGCIFAPDVLKVDHSNAYSDAKLLNNLGVITEFRKYKTSNRLKKTKKGYEGFHQGHLYEHSSWVALRAVEIAKKRDISDEALINLIAATGMLHDIGKSGKCHYDTVEWEQFNPHTIPKRSWCRAVENQTTNEYGFLYEAIPDHPSEGWRILRGLKPYTLFKFSVLTGKTTRVEIEGELTQIDFEKFILEYLDQNLVHMKILRIVVACHWYLGPTISEWEKSNDTLTRNMIIKNYLRRIEMFANAERINIKHSPTFELLLKVLMIVSEADIEGAIYDINLQAFKNFGINNELPNYKIFEYVVIKVADANNVSYTSESELFNLYETNKDFKDFVDQKLTEIKTTHGSSEIANLIATIARENTESVGSAVPLPIEILNKIRKFSEEFYNETINIYNNDFEPNPSNNFIILDNLVNAFGTVDIFKAYSYVNGSNLQGEKKYALGKYLPKVIALDLDGTLLEQKDDTNTVNKNINYTFVKDINEIISMCQKLRRKYGVKIAIASRHYIPLRLLSELLNPNSPLYYLNFDIIISQYTGDVRVISDYCNGKKDKSVCLNLTDACISETAGFYENKNCTTGKYGIRKIPGQHAFVEGEYDIDNPLFAGKKDSKGETEGTKVYHIQEIMKYANCSYEDIILFDDGYHYILHPEEYLGGKVFTAGVMPYGKLYGLQLDLLHRAIAIYVFEKMRKL